VDKAQKLGGSKHRLLCENCVQFMLKVKNLYYQMSTVLLFLAMKSWG